MKHFILIIVVICMAFVSKAQYAPVNTNSSNSHQIDNSEYKALRNRSTNVKIEAVILNITAITACAVGTGMFVVGEIDKSSVAGDGSGTVDANGNFIPSNSHSDDQLINGGIAITGVGVLIGIGSAILYTRSAMLYHKSREIKMNMNTNSINIPHTGTTSIRIPMIGVGCTLSL